MGPCIFLKCFFWWRFSFRLQPGFTCTGTIAVYAYWNAISLHKCLCRLPRLISFLCYPSASIFFIICAVTTVHVSGLNKMLPVYELLMQASNSWVKGMIVSCALKGTTKCKFILTKWMKPHMSYMALRIQGNMASFTLSVASTSLYGDVRKYVYHFSAPNSLRISPQNL